MGGGVVKRKLRKRSIPDKMAGAKRRSAGILPQSACNCGAKGGQDARAPECLQRSLYETNGQVHASFKGKPLAMGFAHLTVS